MFDFQGRKDQGYLGNLRDRGHQLFYHYDAFGGVFTQLWNPYNQVGLTGKSYDIEASPSVI